MTRTLVPALVVGAVLCTVVPGVTAAPLAQEPPKPAAEARPDAKGEVRSARIFVVDVEAIWKNSLLGKRLAAQLQEKQNEISSLGNKKNAELQKLSNEIKTMEEELQKQAGVLSPEVVEKRQRDVNKKKRDAQDFLEEGQQELDRLRQALQEQDARLKAEFLQKINPHIETVAKEKRVDVLLHSQAVLLPPARDFDLSPEVIVKVDDDERASRTKEAPKAGEKPPAKPPATTTPASPAPSPTPKP
jgi:Skp family chaperone for outer membrane proteins